MHFLHENVSISIKMSLKFVPKDPINNIAALVQIMACRRPGDRPLSEPMMVSLLTHICVTRPQCVNDPVLSNLFIDVSIVITWSFITNPYLYQTNTIHNYTACYILFLCKSMCFYSFNSSTLILNKIYKTHFRNYFSKYLWNKFQNIFTILNKFL